jgi:hypothetical protein
MASTNNESYSIGIDVGGTFTDCVLVDAQGRATVEKTFTTPADPSEGVLNGLEKFSAKLGLSLGDFLGRVARIVHGTTITTNAVLTGRGAKTGFLDQRFSRYPAHAARASASSNSIQIQSAATAGGAQPHVCRHRAGRLRGASCAARS